MGIKAKGSEAPAAGSALPIPERFLRIARECRVLADECERGIAPPLIAREFGTPEARCALGWVLSRSIDGGNPWDAVPYPSEAPSRRYAARVNGASRAVIEANNLASDTERARAVIAPLRVLATAFEVAT